MPFYFIHPLYLAGLITASVPLLIHLLNRRRLRRIRFPAVRFVLLSQRRITRSYRLRHWLLLALRTLGVLLLVLLLAHPIFQTGIGLFAGGGPMSAVMVLDNSLSMDWSRGSRGFDKARGAVRTLVSSLQEEDRVALLPTNRSPMRRIRFRNDRDAVLIELEGIGITAGTADFAAALAKAHELLKEPAAQKSVWLVTDMALTGWDRFALSSLGQYDPLIPLKIINVSRREKRLNATIKEIKVRSQRTAVGLPVHMDVFIVNFSEEKIKDLPVQLNLDKRDREQKLVNLPPKGETAISFQFKLDRPGSYQGHIQLKKADVAGNPKAHFTLQAREKLNILIVDGDPKTSLIQSETFFLTRALNPTGKKESSFFLPTVIVPEALQSVSLDSYQAIIFCNVERIPARMLPKITEHLRRGGGLLLFLGDHIDRRDYNQKLFRTSPPILPAKIGDKKILLQSKGEKIAKVKVSHPALGGLADSVLKASLTSARVHGFHRASAPPRSTLISLANGDPLLMEKKVGPGKVLLLTTAADLDWNDLPFKTIYLPLMQSLTLYLAGGRGGFVDTGVTAGTTKILSLPPSYVGKSMRIARPDRKEREVTFVAAGEKASASFRENDLAGIYRILQLGARIDQPGKDPPLSPIYAVNPPFLESRLQEVTLEELQAKLQPMNLELITLDSLEKGGTKMDLSFPLLLAAILTLASEGWLAQRIYE